MSGRQRKLNRGTTSGWRTNAPARLIEAYEKNEVSLSRTLLKSLLTDPSLDRAWLTISKEVRTQAEWMRVWAAIVGAKQMSRRKGRSFETPQQEQSRWTRVAERTEALGKEIRGGVLDVDAYELLPSSIWAALGVPGWAGLTEEQQCTTAHLFLTAWPQVAELLDELEKKARLAASGAVTRPRAASRRVEKIEERQFAWHLVSAFQARFSKQLLGTVAQLTDAVFHHRSGIDKRFVQAVAKTVPLKPPVKP